jgi:hypothetical protein
MGPDTNTLVPLAWDSEHFGMLVGRLRSDLEDAALTAVLTRARAAGFQLVYWPTTTPACARGGRNTQWS